MWLMAVTFLSFICTLLLYLATMAIMARLFGVSIKGITIGFGKQVASFGMLSFGRVPTGGAISLKMTADISPGEDSSSCFDAKNQ